MNIETIKEKIHSNSALSREEAEYLYKNAGLESLKNLATQAKLQHHPMNIATYLTMAIVNYTNVCVAKCDYCSFYRLPHQSGTYLLDFDQICAKIDQLLAFGGTLVSFNGGFHPKLSIYDYAELFNKVHKRYPQLTFYEMTVAEFMFTCKRSKVSYDQGAQILKEAGTQWVTGGGAEILDDQFRLRHSPGKYKVADYYDAQEAILNSGIGSTATMVIGFDETVEERFNHLEKLRKFQEKSSHKMPSFLCWTYKPYNNELGGKEISSSEYLRWLAICRLYLNNFVNIRTSVLTQNERGLEGLNFGANDFDIPTEDEVTEKAGATISHDFEHILSSLEHYDIKGLHRGPFTMA